MDHSLSRNNILLKISTALKDSTPMPFPAADLSESVFKLEHESLETLFERKFTGLLGKFFLLDNAEELKEKYRSLILENEWTHVCSNESFLNQLLGDPSSPFVSSGTLYDTDAAITDCAHLIAQTGTIVLRSDQSSGRALPVYAPVHIVIAFSHQLVFDLEECIEKVMISGKELPSSLVFASGPSRTGDIEKTLVVGVHGPKEVYVLMLKCDSESIN